MFQNGTILNWDFDSEYFFVKYRMRSPDTWQQDAKDFLEECYTHCGIRDLVFNIFSQLSLTPSQVFTDVVDKLGWTEENGQRVDYTKHHYLPLHASLRKAYGYGPTEVWIEHCKRLGIRPWISIRMNDNHYRDEPTCYLRSRFFYEALEQGWVLGEGYRSGHRNWDYDVPQVRNKLHQYLSEQLKHFDVYGIELDFSREAKCIRYLHGADGSGLDLFMEEAKRRVQECEKLHGHPIAIHVRLPRDISLCERIGFHCVHWAKMGWVDSVTPTGHWLACDTGMPIQVWVDALAPYGVEVWPGMDMCMPHKLFITPEIAKAHTVQYAAQGAARSYIFNYYHPNLQYMKENGSWFEIPSLEEMRSLWQVAGDLSLAKRGLRRHVLTEESLGFQELMPRWAPLPCLLSQDNPLEIQTGEISPQDRVTFYLGIQEGDFPRLSLNGQTLPPPQKAEDAFLMRNPTIDPKCIAAYTADGLSFAPLIQSITAHSPTKVFYLEVAVTSI